MDLIEKVSTFIKNLPEPASMEVQLDLLKKDPETQKLPDIRVKLWTDFLRQQPQKEAIFRDKTAVAMSRPCEECGAPVQAGNIEILHCTLSGEEIQYHQRIDISILVLHWMEAHGLAPVPCATDRLLQESIEFKEREHPGYNKVDPRRPQVKLTIEELARRIDDMSKK